MTFGEFFDENANVMKYVARMKSISTIKEYINSERYIEKPFHNKVAKINNL